MILKPIFTCLLATTLLNLSTARLYERFQSSPTIVFAEIPEDTTQNDVIEIMKAMESLEDEILAQDEIEIVNFFQPLPENFIDRMFNNFQTLTNNVRMFNNHDGARMQKF